MPSCSIKQCSFRANKNIQQTSLHKFPKQDAVRHKWLKAIGIENLNPRHTQLYICSLHFDESAFSRNKQFVRLRKDAIPSVSFLGEPTNENRTRENLVPSTSTQSNSDSKKHPTIPKLQQEKSTKLLKNCLKCAAQKKKVKQLREKIRRQSKKIASLQGIIDDSNNGPNKNTEQELITLEDSGGSKDFLERQMVQCKGLPAEKKYSEEVRKFASTLHYLSPKAYEFIRKTYPKCLPHPRTLTKWYQGGRDSGNTGRDVNDSP